MNVTIAICTSKYYSQIRKKVVTNIEEAWDSDEITLVLVIKWNSWHQTV